MIENKKSYLDLCRSHSSIPLFLQPWWLDQVCEAGDWEVALTFDQGKNITAVLPYYIRTTWGVKMIRIPTLTPYIGAWINYPNQQKRNRRYAFEKKVITELLDQIPRTIFSAHHHTRSISNGLPFLWKNHEVTNLYTYQIYSGTPLDTIKSGMKSSVRNKIEKASQQLRIEESDTPEEFYQINQLTFDRQKMKMPYTLKFFKKLDQTLKQREQRKILIAKDISGVPHAAIYLVWDQRTLYNLALGGDTNLRNSGAIQLLLWEGIQLAMAKSLNFDFEGSVIESIEGVFRDFGAEQVPYLRTTKYGNRFWKALSVIIKGK